MAHWTEIEPFTVQLTLMFNLPQAPQFLLTLLSLMSNAEKCHKLEIKQKAFIANIIYLLYYPERMHVLKGTGLTTSRK